MSIGIRDDGAVVIPQLIANSVEQEIEYSPVIKADNMHMFSFGQSLSIGSQAYAVISTTQPYNNLTFKSGVTNVGYNPYDMSAFRPLVENHTSGPSGQLGETPISGCCNHIANLMGSDYTGYGISFVGSAPGEGNTTIAGLSKPNYQYRLLVGNINAAYSLSQTAGKTYNVQCVFWFQGEADNKAGTSRDEYVTLLRTLQNDIYHDAAAITGQDFRPPFIGYQIASHKYYNVTTPNIALAQLDAARQFNDIHVAVPMYIFDYSSDHLHLTATSSWVLGAYCGRVYDRVYNHGEEWTGLTIRNAVVQGRIIQVELNVPDGPLVIDTAAVATTKDYGFSIRTVGHSVRHDIIQSVSLSGPNRVRITLSAALPVGAYLCYGFGEPGDIAGAGRLTGARGNIRDSSADTATDPTGIVHKLHNWMLISDHQLEA